MSSTFYLPPKDRIGYLTLIILFLLISASTALYQNIFSLNESEQLALIEEVIAKEKQSAQAQIRELRTLEQETQSLTSIKLGTFDPNEASKETLIAQGFSEYAANNLEKYRDKGGKIKESNDLFRIYGLDSAAIIQMKDRLILPKSKIEVQSQQKKREAPDTPSNQTPKVVKEAEIEDLPKREFFDPNTASQEDLQKYGLSSYAAKNLTKYVAKGGRLKEPKDLKRIYGIDNDTYAKVLPHIKIEKTINNNNKKVVKITDSISQSASPISHEDLLESEETVKEAISLNINVASQEELMKISGIGPAISKGIVKYREMLGGYIEISQLKEVYNVTEEAYQQISQHLFVEGAVKRFYIPSTKFKDVLRHPYIDYETTKIVKGMSIMNYNEDFQILIDNGTIDQRLLPYLHLVDPDLD